MAEVVPQIGFTVTFTSKEFSVVTRALAGHVLKTHDLVLARELNLFMVQKRASILKQMSRQASRAEEVAVAECPSEEGGV